MSKSAAAEVVHNSEAKRFEIAIDGALSVADYEMAGDSVIVFTHTLVPGPLRGRGIAGRLVRAALDYARSAGLRVEPRCSYVAAFIDRHDEYQLLIA